MERNENEVSLDLVKAFGRGYGSWWSQNQRIADYWTRLLQQQMELGAMTAEYQSQRLDAYAEAASLEELWDRLNKLTSNFTSAYSDRLTSTLLVASETAEADASVNPDALAADVKAETGAKSQSKAA